MISEPTITDIAAISGLTLVTIASVPHVLLTTITRCTGRRKYSELSTVYEDKDGEATTDSQAAYSDLPQRITLLLSSFLGTALAIALLVLNLTDAGSHHAAISQNTKWLLLASWILTFIQTCNIFVTSSFTERFRLGAWTALSGLGLLAATLSEELVRYSSKSHPQPPKLVAVSSVLLAVLSALVLAASLSIPRRPAIFKDGKVVDREYTVSLANRFTFSWASPVLEYATKNRKLTHDDLPVVNYSMRAQQLQHEFEAVGRQDKLWKQIAWAHWRALVAQWSLQTLSAFTNFLPQIVLFSVLKLLEARDNGANNQFLLWLVAIAMGLAVAFGSWLESLMFYVCFLKLGIPVYEQLSAVIFAKAIRKKDVKSAAKVDQDAEINGEITNTKRMDTTDDETAVATKEDTEKDDDEEVTKTKQSTINLIGVDAKRVSDFCTYQYLFLGSALKIAIAVVFLTRLVGWIPMLAAFAVPVLISPLNYFISSKYSHTQDELMKYRDQKMAVVTEALQGIRQIKFSALETDWYERILKTRRKELRHQWRAFCLDTCLISIWIFGPAFMSALSLAAYAWINGTLSASVAFTTLSVFEAIEMTLAVIPEMVTEMIDAIVSARRIQNFLDSAERTNVTEKGEKIAFRNATVSWPSDEKEEQDRTFRLEDLNLEFQMGELNVISGRTGSGKSLLLAAIIGEADVLEGKLIVPHAPAEQDRFDAKANKTSWIIPEAVAYVSQIPWIENATLRDNILFGLPYDEQRYKSVLSASALEKDLDMLQDGDMTDIGANGINLSGGQKWRATFARALYSRAGILVLDDIFSAVDAHVGRQLYDSALTGDLCKGRTRILVTHHVALCLPATKYLVLLEDGHALHAGSVEELRIQGHLSDILEADIRNREIDKENAEAEDDAVVDDGGQALTKVMTNQSQKSRRMSSMSQQDRQGLARQTSKITTIAENGVSDTAKTQPKKFTEDENREIGAINFNVYKTYLKSCRGYVYWCCLATVFLSWIGIYLGRSYWVSHWTRQYDTESIGDLSHITVQSTPWHQIAKQKYTTLRADKKSNDTLYYMGVYIGLSIVAWLIGTVRYFTVYFASIQGSRVMFEKLANTILRAPLRFLDTTPVGRISNRFTADFNNIDSRMANDLGFMLHCLISVLSVVIAGTFVSPVILLFAILLLVFCGYFAKRFIRGAREIKRLESNAKSPIFEQFGSVLTGIGTIRAFQRSESYLEKMYAKINIHCTCYWHVYLFSRWMSFRANMVGAAFTFATAALIVTLVGIDAALAGFVLSFSLDLSESVIWMLRQYANVELNFNAVERVIEYSDLETEVQGGENVPAAWPTKGEIEVDDLVITYAADLPPVLKGINFTVNSNERVGVIGRTGAGKSSLTLALFRFLEATSGSIQIDGIDISNIKLYDLRSRLAIIPQDPVLFSGTVRSNLDPFDQHTDAELRDALARVHLLDLTSTVASGTTTPVRRVAEIQSDADNTGMSTPVNKNTSLSLKTRISESGLNLSQGQRQLLCLARAIVSRPRILVLDEATSSVDMETDRLIQQSIREEFGGRCTLIVIAHRLSTIVDFDRVLVLGQGQVVEYGTPKELYEAKELKEGSFKEMVDKSGEKALLEDVIFEKSRK